jgi:programmed cell death protein 5
MSEDELNEIRKRYMAQHEKESDEERQKDEQQRAQYEAMKQNILRSILSEGATQRLANIKLVKPQLAEAIENHLVQLTQSRRIPPGGISEEKFLQMLRQLTDSKRDSKIEFRRS